MYQALYRKYRPEIFDDLLGQEHIIKILKNQIAAGSVSHAYLFCGTRGTGKTTTARLLAKGVNCLAEGDRPCGRCKNCMAIKEGNFLDVIEIDAASNNGVDNIRELRENVKYPPVLGRKKIYIIDEVHMLSTGAFNALLKTLEEPPENVMFILATTEPQKLPATILSRCMRLDFKRVPEAAIKKKMAEICAEAGTEVADGALNLIAVNADGSVRDGLSILDQCLAGGEQKLSREDVLTFLGASGEEVFLEMTDMVLSRKTSQAILYLDQILADGKDVRQFMKDWLAHYRGLLISKFVRRPEDMLNVSAENAGRMKEQSERMDLADIDRGIRELSASINEARWSTQPRILLELCMVRLSTGDVEIRKQQSSGGVVRPVGKPAGSAAASPTEQAEAIQDAGIAPKSDMAEAVLNDAVGREKSDAAEGTEPQKKDAAAEAGTALPEMEKASAAGVLSRTKRQEDTAAKNRVQEAEINTDVLWDAVAEAGEAAQGSFRLVHNMVKLTAVSEKSFTLTADNEVAAELTNRHRLLIEELMERYTGQYRSMKCVRKGEKTPESAAAGAGDRRQIVADEFSAAFGIEPESGEMPGSERQ